MKNLTFLLIALAIVIAGKLQAQETTIKNKSSNDTFVNLQSFDSNKDGIMTPFEVLDVMLIAQKQAGSNLKIDQLAALLNESDGEDEFLAEFEEADRNKNGKIELEEVDKETAQFLVLMDTDGDKAVSKEEIKNFNIESAFFISDDQIEQEVATIFSEYGDDKEVIVLADISKKIRKQLSSLDIDGNGELTKQEATQLTKANSSEAQFIVKGDVAYMNGTICTTTPAKVLELLFQHPEVKTIEMQIVPGSINDVANLRASLYVHRFGLNTRVTKNSLIASGGTDFFLAGKKREVEEGATIGVHSWGGGPTAATKLPKDHEAHQKYLDYYRQVDIPESFYWYTLQAAPADDIHNMTSQEIKQYNVTN